MSTFFKCQTNAKNLYIHQYTQKYILSFYSVFIFFYNLKYIFKTFLEFKILFIYFILDTIFFTMRVS